MKTIYQLLKELGINYSKRWFQDNILSSKIKCLLKNNQYYIDDDEFDRVIRVRKCNLAYDTIIPEECITRFEAINKYNIPKDLLQNREEKNVVKNGGLYFYRRSFIEKYISQKEKVKKYEKNDKWTNILLVQDKDIHRKLNMYKNNQQLYKKYYVQIPIGGHKETFINNEFIKMLYEGFKVKRNVKSKYDTNIITKDDVDNILMKLQCVTNKNIIKSKKIKINDFVNISKISIDHINKILKDNNVFSEVYKDGENYISLNLVELIMNLKGLYSLQKMCEVAELPYSYFRNKINKSEYKNLKISYTIENRIFIKINEHRKILEEYSLLTLPRIDDDKEFLLEKMKFFRKDLCKTTEAAIVFLNSEREILYKNASQDLRIQFNRIIEGVYCFTNDLSKEIYDTDKNEIITILLKIKVGYRTNVCKYINWCKEKYFNKTKYDAKFGLTMLKQYRLSAKENISQDIYESEIWTKYYFMLRDIDSHIFEAINDYRYSQIWLYCILNLSLTWRMKNILSSIPNISLEEVGIFDFEWFKQKNKFTLQLADSIIEQLKFSLDGIVAFKNKKNLHIAIPMSLKIPTAIALILCEIHRRTNNKEKVFYELIRRKPARVDYKKIFRDHEELCGFTNLKCTRSIMTYGYSNAVNNIGKSSVAYSINTYGRSHKKTVDNLSNTTYEYFRLDTMDGGAKEYMYHIMERGSFGFLYYKIFQCVINQNEMNEYTLEDVTEIIKNTKLSISPLTIENSASELINNDNEYMQNTNDIKFTQLISNLHSKKIDVNGIDNLLIQIYKENAKELLGESQEIEVYIDERYKEIINNIEELNNNKCDFNEILKNIAEGSNSCFTEYSNCIYDKLERKEKCPYKDSNVESCIGCKNNLPRAYSLYEVSKRLNKLLDNMISDNENNENRLRLNSHLIKMYLTIIVEAKTSFKRYGNYIDNIVNLKEIKKKVLCLKNNNKIL